MPKKVCRTCKIFVEGELCPICKKSSFSTNWQGLITITDAKRSKIAQQMGIETNGEYCIKVR
ncbi:MAG: transcription elongation factor subunit Spt4 [Nanobdellota archaeon]